MDGVYSLFFLPQKKEGLIVGKTITLLTLLFSCAGQYSVHNIAMAVCVHFSDVFDMRSD